MTQFRRIALLALALSGAGVCDASYIDYTYTTTLRLNPVVSPGTDFAGLDGAKIVFHATVDTNAVYIERFGNPALVANPGATLVISGSSIAANNGTIALELQAFYPLFNKSFSGFFNYSDGISEILPLATGSVITVNLGTLATAHAAAVNAGDNVNTLDFAPTIVHPGNYVYIVEPNKKFGAYYDQTDAVITATIVPTAAVPEPSSLAFCGIASLVGLGYARSRGKRAA